jgi:uncharacterized membrane protein
MLIRRFMSLQLITQVVVATKVHLILISLILLVLAIKKRQTEKGEEAIVNNLT